MITRWSLIALSILRGLLFLVERLRLAQIRIALGGDSVSPDRHLFLIANHTSWWDGFLLLHVYRALGRRGPLLTLMLERQLRSYPMLRWIGAVGLEPGNTASIRNALDEVGRFAREGPLTVAFFPQGFIWPSTRRPLGFQPGIERLVDRVDDAALLPVGIHFELLTRPKPTAFVSVGNDIAGPSATLDQLEQAVTTEVDSILENVQTKGERIMQEDPRPFVVTSHKTRSQSTAGLAS